MVGSYVKYMEFGRLLFLVGAKLLNVGTRCMSGRNLLAGLRYMEYWYPNQDRLSALETLSPVERLTRVKSLGLCQEEA